MPARHVLRRPSRSAAAVVLALLLLTSCGGGRADQPAGDLLAEARAAAEEAGSVSVTGELLEDGRRVTLDLDITDGRGGRGTISQGGQVVQVVDTGEQLYLNADRAFWTEIGGDVAAERFADQWLEIPADRTDQFAQFRTFTDLSSFIDQVFTPQGPVENAGEEELDGEPVIALRDSEVDGSALYVAAEGQPYPVQIRGPRGSGSVSFEEWGEEVDTSAPADALDLGALTSAEPSPGAEAPPAPEATPAPTP